VLACIGVGFLLGVAEEVLAIRPLRSKGAHGELVTTLGVAVLLDGVAVLIWGTNPHFVNFGTATPLSVFGGRIYPAEVALVLVGLGGAVVADTYTRRTLFGKMSLAAAEDRDAARLRGIDVSKLSLLSFGLAGAVCMVGGLLVAAKTGASAGLGAAFAVKGFVALAIGGFGSQKGALVGGMAAGLVEAFAARYAGASYQNLSVFVLLVALLMVRPTGLFGEKGQRVV
jgi:branched-chain amino acid transport system permease protein